MRLVQYEEYDCGSYFWRRGGAARPLVSLDRGPLLFSSSPPHYITNGAIQNWFITLPSLYNYLIVCPLLFPAVLLRSSATLHSLLFLPLRLLQLQLRLQTPPEVQQPVPELLVLGPQALHLRGQLTDNGGIQTST